VPVGSAGLALPSGKGILEDMGRPRGAGLERQTLCQGSLPAPHVSFLPFDFKHPQTFPASVFPFNGPGYGAVEETTVEPARGYDDSSLREHSGNEAGFCQTSYCHTLPRASEIRGAPRRYKAPRVVVNGFGFLRKATDRGEYAPSLVSNEVLRVPLGY
jgi:hypothetical protein